MAKLKAQDAKTESLKTQLTAKDEELDKMVKAHEDNFAQATTRTNNELSQLKKRADEKDRDGAWIPVVR